MKPLISELHDDATLKALGRASVQIVHDLKNQLNGLKLYATFLRKRMEKGDHPADELETIAKLIAGLERAASDMTTLVRYGRPLELRLQPGTNLSRLLAKLEDEVGVEIKAEESVLVGNFDVAAIAEAFKTITSNAIGMLPSADSRNLSVRARLAEGHRAVIEWTGIKTENGDDPFHSFAGSEGLRMSLAAKIIEAHGGDVGHDQNALRVSLPVARD